MSAAALRFRVDRVGISAETGGLGHDHSESDRFAPDVTRSVRSFPQSLL
jgi:hypothetical protein